MRLLAICVATYRRNELLGRLLESLQALEDPVDTRIELRIVDNDGEGQARAVVENTLREIRFPYSYTVEPRQNIALARNAALDLGPADLFAFVDDDEVVRPDWARKLVECLDRTGADAVFGPVEGVLPKDSAAWLGRSGFFDKRTGPDGRALDWTQTRTSNTLVSGTWFDERGFRFDEGFGRSGSSDSELFQRLEREGARFASAAQAGVWEDVEPHRANLRWLIKRHYRNGLTFHRIQSQGGRPPAALVRAGWRVSKALWYLVSGLPGIPFGRSERSARGACLLALTWGGIRAWAAAGTAQRFVEYGERPAEPPGRRQAA